MLLVGLTGGIGSGKSTVSAALVSRGAALVDADAIVRELQAPGSPVLSQMAARFGAGVIAPDGSLDRAAVAAIVFSDPEALADLNSLIHPRVGEEIERRIAELAPEDRVVVLDSPLLVETGIGRGVRAVIVVETDPETAVTRLVQVRGLTEADARARIANQASREERRAKADFVILNDGTLDELEAEIERCWTWLQELRRADGGVTGPG